MSFVSLPKIGGFKPPSVNLAPEIPPLPSGPDFSTSPPETSSLDQPYENTEAEAQPNRKRPRSTSLDRGNTENEPTKKKKKATPKKKDKGKEKSSKKSKKASSKKSKKPTNEEEGSALHMDLETMDRNKHTLKDIMKAKGGKLTKKRQELEEKKRSKIKKPAKEGLKKEREEPALEKTDENDPFEVSVGVVHPSDDDGLSTGIFETFDEDNPQHLIDDNDPPREEFDDEFGFGSEDDADLFCAPQVLFDESGQLVVDKKSVVMKSAKRDSIGPQAVTESTSRGGGYGKKAPSERWTKEETKRFYEIIRIVGSDFQLLTEYFPGKDRKRIRAKFKREEKINPAGIDWAMKNPLSIGAPNVAKKDCPDDFDLFIKEEEELEPKPEVNKEVTSNLNPEWLDTCGLQEDPPEDETQREEQMEATQEEAPRQEEEEPEEVLEEMPLTEPEEEEPEDDELATLFG